MLKLRTILMSSILVAFLVLTVQMVTVGTDTISKPESGTGNVAEGQEISTRSEKTYNVPEYRSQFGECSDVSIAELAACRTERQIPVQDLYDECFDVSLMEIATCRSATRSSTP